MTTTKKREKITGIIIIVIGSIFLVFMNIYGYLYALQLPGVGGSVFILPTIIGVVIIIIGLLPLLTSRKKITNINRDVNG